MSRKDLLDNFKDEGERFRVGFAMLAVLGV